MAFQDDKFGHKTYEYLPAWEKDVERSPDKQPSHEIPIIVDRGEEVLYILKVRGLGAFTMRAVATSSGKWDFAGVAIFTDEQIQFD